MKMKKLPAVFYATGTGNEPVREWLKNLSQEDRKIVGTDIMTAEFGWPIGMPTCSRLEGKLYEIRSNISGSRISRVLFAEHGGKMVLLHAFVKKTPKTPKQDLDLAKRRLKEIQR
jgi:phage-related protein